MNKLRASIKFVLFILLTIPIVAAQSIMLVFHRGKWSYNIPCLWQIGVCHIFRIKIKTIGSPLNSEQVIYVSNHLSYLDIPAIGGLLKASFVAKKEVASWPLFGFLSKLQQTAYISRDKSDARQAKNNLENMLAKGKSLIIFPEGTSTDGKEVIPFKSSLFSIAFKDGLGTLYIQPITIKMEAVDNREVKTQKDRDIYSWHINMDTPLAKHLWLFAQSKGAQISITFHSPVKVSDFKDRKTLAKACHNTVSNGLNI